MMGTRIKMCGVTRAEDAALAAKLGVDYIGVIFADSARRVDATVARAIRAAVPHTPIVGVFRDQPLDDVAELANDAEVDILQLHGTETPGYCQELQRRAGRNIIKTFIAGAIPDAQTLGTYETTSFFLFDLDKNPLTNGREAAARESLWNDVAVSRRQGFRVFLAGALKPENVRDAVARTGAFCVDVCRGVEASPGVKDHDAIARFVREVRG